VRFLLITKTIDKVMTGEIRLQDLIVSKFLGQDLDKYRSLFPHVAAERFYAYYKYMFTLLIQLLTY
jgi:hypothetical protein